MLLPLYAPHTPLCKPTYILMFESCEDADLPQSSLTVGLMIKRTYLLYSNLLASIGVEGGAVWVGWGNVLAVCTSTSIH